MKRETTQKQPRLSTRPQETFTVSSAVALNPNITPHEKIVYLVLAAYADENNACSLQQKTIADHCERSPRFIRKLLTALRSKQCVRWVRRYRYNIYTLVQ